MTAPPLLVIGASARAFSASAHRSGWRVRAVDLFADRDLAGFADAVAVPADEYPGGLVAAADAAPQGPWCYVGALENRPELVDTIAARRVLAGCPGSVLRGVRDPGRLAAALADAGVAFPTTRFRPDGLPLDGSWLVKPRRGAGGRGIAPWVALVAAEPHHDAAPGRMWQRRVEGEPVSAAFVVDAGGARLVGASRQILGARAWHAPPFVWCGAEDVPPAHLGEGALRQWSRVGAVLHREFGVRGAVGVDAIAAPDGRIVVVEVNPRPTASMELAERRSGLRLAAEHLAAHGHPSPPTPAPAAIAGAWVKAVPRAAAVVSVTPAINAAIDRLGEGWARDDGVSAIADLPRDGTTLPAGAPILTLFAVGTTPAEARAVLGRRVAQVQRLLARDGV